MHIISYPSADAVEKGIAADEPLMAVIAFDGKTAIVGLLDDCVEHHILLAKAGYDATDIDRFFRIIFDRGGADWTFICPSDYQNIPYKDRRIRTFYRNGFSKISDFLQNMGYLVGVNIPRRYQWHLQMLQDDSAII